MVRRNYRGMRSGLSIVEMMVAVILFGVISTIGYKYSKNFYDVTLASKQTLVSAVVDQATQISNAYDLYEIKTGAAPTDIDDLSNQEVRILKETPAPVLEITADSDGWKIEKIALDDDDATDDPAFIYKVSASGLDADKKQEYCNVLNNIIASKWDLNASSNSGSSGTTDETIGLAKEMYAKTEWSFKHIMCFTNDADDEFTFAFIKKHVN